MINTKFEAYKIKREIRRSGMSVIFKRYGANQFGEPNEEESVVGELNGLYHEESSRIQVTTGDTTQIQTKKSPMLLCLYEDAILLGLKIGDFIVVNGKKMKYTGMTNVQEWNIIADISLEVINIGN